MGISLPPDFRDLMQHQIGNWAAFEAAHQQPPPTSIRINPAKWPAIPDLNRVPWCQNGFYLPERPRFSMDPLFHAGVYYPQEAGSMLLDVALRQLPVKREGLRVLDLCAAPGGKSTIVLDWLDGDGFLVSNEVIPKRARVLQENMDKWGRCNRLVSNSDPAQFAKLGPVFDVVVIDAPCSGEGMFRKEPDALTMWNPEVVEKCSQRQCGITGHALQCLKPGGFLIYSTCTYNRRENEEVIQSIIEKTGAEVLKLDVPAEWNVETSETGTSFGYRCFPHRTQSEGFFISVLQVPENHSEPAFRRKEKKKIQPSAEVNSVLKGWLKNAERFAAIEHHGETFFLPEATFDFAQHLSKNIHVLSIGQQAGRVIRNELIPGGPLALSSDLHADVLNTIVMTAENAIAYLSKSTFQVTGHSDGLVLCTHRDIPCGWAKIISGKLKNQWPKEWRILHPQDAVPVVL